MKTHYMCAMPSTKTCVNLIATFIKITNCKHINNVINLVDVNDGYISLSQLSIQGLIL